MRVISGTLRFWNDGASVEECRLDRVTFAFEGTWEPSLVVEHNYVAQVMEWVVRYSEIDGLMSGVAIAVEGAAHAELSDWGLHQRSANGDLVWRPGTSFVDRGNPIETLRGSESTA